MNSINAIINKDKIIPVINEKAKLLFSKKPFLKGKILERKFTKILKFDKLILFNIGTKEKNKTIRIEIIVNIVVKFNNFSLYFIFLLSFLVLLDINLRSFISFFKLIYIGMYIPHIAIIKEINNL